MNLVLSTFNHSLFTSSQLLTLPNCVFMVYDILRLFSSFIVKLHGYIKFVSSAKDMISRSEADDKSFMYIMNRRGPRIEP